MNKALDVAKYILWYCNEHSVNDCSNKKLQKLLYYIQAWSLALRGKVIFSEPIEAWLHGPVVVSVYHTYKDYGFSPIQFNPKTFKADQFTSDEKSLMNAVLEKYSKFDAAFLEMRTHIEKPWLETRQKDEKIIPNSLMEEYYKSVMKSSPSNV